MFSTFLSVDESLNPGLVEGFIPCLGAVSPTYPWDLNPEGFLDLCHSNVIPILLGLIPSPLCLDLCLLGLLKFFLKPDDLSFGGDQLIFNVTNEHPLALGLFFNTIKSCYCTFPFSLLFQQLLLKLFIALLGQI